MNFDIGQDIISIENYGKVIYLLGSAELGGVNAPVKILNEQMLYDIFGTTGTLIEGYKQVLDIASSCDVICCKVTGTHSMISLDLNIRDQQVVEGGLVFKSKYANEIYNNIIITIDNAGLSFYFPVQLGGGSRRYNFSDYEILGLLIRAVNTDTKSGLNHVHASTNTSQGTSLSGLIYSVNPDQMQMQGGYSGLIYNKNQYYFLLQDTYNLLESENIDIILPLDACMDDVHPRFYYGNSNYEQALFYSNQKDYLDILDSNSKPLTFHKQLIDYCKRQMRFGLITHGVMGFNKIQDIEELNNQRYNYIEVINASPVSSREGFTRSPETDDGFFISVVAGEFEYSNGVIANGCTAYAGIMANNIISESLTNKPLGDKIKLETIFTTDDLGVMSRLGVVSFRNSVLNGLVVSNAVTPVEDNNNEMHYSCNIRMIQLTLCFLKLQLDKFLGEDINVLVKNDTINKTVKNLLENLVEQKVLKSFGFNTNINKTTGECTINVDLKTLYMIETFSASTGMNFEI